MSSVFRAWCVFFRDLSMVGRHVGAGIALDAAPAVSR